MATPFFYIMKPIHPFILTVQDHKKVICVKRVEYADFRRRLQEEKRAIETRLQKNSRLNMQNGHWHEAMGELSSYDNHPADEGTELFERGKDLALAEHETEQLRKIEAALEAIENGTYGKCKVCGKPISKERLDILPETLFCKEHSPEQKVSRDRPIEEKRRSTLVANGREGEWMADDADAWREVSSWGTSDTLPDFSARNIHEKWSFQSKGNRESEETYENFVGVDLSGRNIPLDPNGRPGKDEEDKEEELGRTVFGDRHP